MMSYFCSNTEIGVDVNILLGGIIICRALLGSLKMMSSLQYIEFLCPKQCSIDVFVCEDKDGEQITISFHNSVTAAPSLSIFNCS